MTVAVSQTLPIFLSLTRSFQLLQTDPSCSDKSSHLRLPQQRAPWTYPGNGTNPGRQLLSQGPQLCASVAVSGAKVRKHERKMREFVYIVFVRTAFTPGLCEPAKSDDGCYHVGKWE
eukprot:1027894-Amorphochlora_amoeboformis.AAC.1